MGDGTKTVVMVRRERRMLRCAAWMLRRAERAGRRAEAVGSVIGRGRSVVEVVRHGLVEDELRDWIAVVRIKGGRLIEQEVSLGRGASW